MNKGFTLIEVVVAFAIAALCLGGAAQVFSSAARNAAQVQERMQALGAAEAVLAAAGVSDAIAPGVRSGALPAGLHWRRTVEPREVEHHGENPGGPAWIAYRVTVEVRKGAQPLVALSSVRLARAP